MRILDIVPGTSVDGPGLRTSIYFAGCRHHCPGCHNPQSWDFTGGREMSVEEIVEEIERHGFNVTLTGGDPLYLLLPPSELLSQPEIEQTSHHRIDLASQPGKAQTSLPATSAQAQGCDLLQLVAELRRRDYTLWCYTGFLFEDILQSSAMRRLLPSLEVLVDGPFIESLRDISLRFRGSSNQRLIDIPASLSAGTPIIWQDTQWSV